jgi:sigma-B regulation protein RsbU (phosphoserine phosphatase)
LLQREFDSLSADFPDLFLVLSVRGRSLVVPSAPAPVSCEARPSWVESHFRGVVVSGNRMFLHASTRVPGWPGALLCLTVPTGENLLAQIGTDIGRFSLLLLEGASAGSERSTIVIGDRRYASVGRIEPVGRALPPPRHFFDPVLNSVSKFDVVQWDPELPQRIEMPVFLSITTRPSLLNQRLFAPLGEVGQVFLEVLFVSGIVFLGLQVISLITGVRLSRRITSAVNDLYAATQRLQAGDFSVRVPEQRQDQLGTLGESFNQMAASIERLIEESRQRQRLQNELEIARQVQEQLFPREVPELKTLALVGRCRAARVVSGDYYDYGLAEPGRLILTIGDISGKGISAALLMATIQSILRSQVYASQLTGQLGRLSVSELVTRVNRQLCATTSTEKFSTLFVGFYDDNTRQLTYTNAGHLLPLRLGRGGTQELAAGGPVVGLFDHLTYEQATIELRPGDWLVAYTDGLTEVENSYEEEYGNERLVAFLERNADSSSPEQLIEAVLAELQQWAPGVEQSDDRTLLVARAL